MRRTYMYESFCGKEYKKGKMILNSSFNHWLRNAKIEEQDNCVVNIIFKYSTKNEVIMTNYDSFNKLNGYHIKLTLLSEIKKIGTYGKI